MKVVMKGEGESGLKTARRWGSIVEALILSGELHLGRDEYIDQVEIDKEFGLTFRIASNK